MRFLLLCFLVFFSLSSHSKLKSYKLDYDFQWEDAFSDNIEVWKKTLRPFKGKEGTRYLEIGTFDGRSFFWMLENILTEQSTKATGIDLYMGDFEKRFQSNLALSKRRKSVTTYKGRSQLILPRLKQEFDIIYIDGSHASWDVLTDIILSWRLLKEGGVLILDDYGWNKTFPDLIRPALSIDAFLATHEKEYEILNKSY